MHPFPFDYVSVLLLRRPHGRTNEQVNVFVGKSEFSGCYSHAKTARGRFRVRWTPYK